MAVNFYVEFRGAKADEKTVVDKVKALWKETGGKVKDIKKIDIYFNGDEGMFYYVINSVEKGSFHLDCL